MKTYYSQSEVDVKEPTMGKKPWSIHREVTLVQSGSRPLPNERVEHRPGLTSRGQGAWSTNPRLPHERQHRSQQSASFYEHCYGDHECSWQPPFKMTEMITTQGLPVAFEAS
jgi:hypothetical protein